MSATRGLPVEVDELEEVAFVAPRGLALHGTRAWRGARAAMAGSGLLGRFSYLLATQATLVSTGLVYWAMTARLVVAREVGVAAAAVSLAALFSTIGMLGVSSVMLVELRHVDPEDRRTVVFTGALGAAVFVGLLCGGSLALSPWVGPSMRAIAANPLEAALYVLGAIAYTVGLVLDSAAIGLRRGPAQLLRNALQAGLRVAIVAAALLVWQVRTSTALLLAWVVSMAVSLLVAPSLLGLGTRVRVGLATRVAVVRRLGGLALRHHVLNLAITSVSFFLPAIAALIVSSRELAFFSVAQLIASTALLPPALLAMSLFAETSGDEVRLKYSIKRTLPVGFACCLLVIGLVEPFAPQVLALFGPQYALHSLDTLRLLVLGGLPYVLKDHYVSIRRAQKRLTEAARVVACSTVFEIAGAAIGGYLYGLIGVCAGWVASAALEGFVFAPPVAKLVFAGRGNATWQPT